MVVSVDDRQIWVEDRLPRLWLIRLESLVGAAATPRPLTAAIPRKSRLVVHMTRSHLLSHA